MTAQTLGLPAEGYTVICQCRSRVPSLLMRWTEQLKCQWSGFIRAEKETAWSVVDNDRDNQDQRADASAAVCRSG
jgi:hypothetical protein